MVIFLGTVAWTLMMLRSGWIYKYGMGFWGPNGHDGVWHVSLASGLARGDFQMPIFAGEQIKNYHLGFDLFLAALHWLTGLPVVNIYFQLLPLLLAALTGVAVYLFVQAWHKNSGAAVWAAAFTYFATSFGWLVSLVRNHNIGGESMFWTQQAISTLINPPFALSVIVIFLGLYFLVTKKYTLATVCFGLLGFIKIYAGILLLGGLFVAGVYALIDQKNYRWLAVWAGALVLSLVLFLPLNRNSGHLIVWQPGWFLETMMGVSDRANWPKYYEAMINYRAAHNLLKGIPAYVIAFAVFVVGNLGLRVVGLATLMHKKLSDMEILFGSIILAGFIIPMFILQTGTPWNTIQFSYYSLVLCGILAGVYVSSLKPQIPIAITFLVLTLPGVWGTLRQYLPNRPPSMISSKELEALNFLAKQDSGIVLTPVYDQKAASAAENNPPRPLYLYESTAYVSAFSNHPVFIEDEVNLNITSYAWQGRAAAAQQFFTTLDPLRAREFLINNHIKYIYLPQIYKVRPQIGQSLIGARTIFDNYEAAIWELN